MRRTTLLIMAAGLGARYGGNKQIDNLGPHGEILMEYSISDAIEAGFDRVVFVIKKDMESIMKEKVGNRISKKVEVSYAFQEYDTLPGGFLPPEDRTKPYGTVHAVLCAKDLIHEPFAVINADDYYGKEAFKVIRHSLLIMPEKCHASMVGYKLRNTVSEHGQVTRGICSVSEQGKLTGVAETYRIALLKNGIIQDMENDKQLDADSLVSMNFWGFTPWIFEMADEALASFLTSLEPGEQKKEYPLPVMVDALMQSHRIEVDVLSTDATWFGVTFQEDRPTVREELLRLHQKGAYSDQLF